MPMRRYLLSKRAPQSGWALRERESCCVSGLTVKPIDARVGGDGTRGGGGGVERPMVGTGDCVSGGAGL